MEAGETFRLRRALLCAALWCAVVAVVESMDQPVAHVSLHEQVSFITLVGWNYLVPGLIWSVGAELPASQRKPLVATIILLLIATAASILTLRMLSPLFGHSSSMAEILFRPPLQDFAGHVFWANLFYGGMFATAYRFTRQNLELRRRLAALRLILGESEMRLREARLRTLNEQLQPAFLMQALQAMQKRYTRNPAEGDRLFDALVALLRAAMPGIRGDPCLASTGTSLIESYAGLRNAIDPTASRWRVAQDALLDTDLPAPARRPDTPCGSARRSNRRPPRSAGCWRHCKDSVPGPSAGVHPGPGWRSDCDRRRPSDCPWPSQKTIDGNLREESMSPILRRTPRSAGLWLRCTHSRRNPGPSRRSPSRSACRVLASQPASGNWSAAGSWTT